MPHLRINQSFIERPFVLFEMTNALIFLNLLEHALDGAEKKLPLQHSMKCVTEPIPRAPTPGRAYYIAS